MNYLEELEKKILERGLTAPRITSEHIDDIITEVQYYQFPKTAVIVCLLTLENGFNVVGESACASVENFDKELVQKIAYENAKAQIWKLEGYCLKQKLFSAGQEEEHY